MSKIIMNLKCPKCGFPAEAKIKRFIKFVIYVCPECQSNVVIYDNKIGILSDQMVKYLMKRKQLKFCGNASFIRPPKYQKGKVITHDKITDLKILLNTETDFDKLLSKL